MLCRARPAQPCAAPPARAGPEDPRTAYAGPFRNISPDVKYVGSAAWGGPAATMTRSPLIAITPWAGRFSPSPRVGAAPPEPAARHNPFDALDSQFRISIDGDTVNRHRRTAFDEAGLARL